MSSFLIQLVARFGLAGILVTMAGESAGLPISSEIVVPLGGALAASGQLNFWAVVLASTIGNVLGSVVAFLLTRRYGERVVVAHGRRVGLNQHHLDLSRRLFDRFGLAAVFIGRLLPVVRTYISFPAGLSRMGLGPFILVTFLGALPWNFGLAYAGLLLGRNYTAIEHRFGWVTLLVGALVLLGLILVFMAGRRAARRSPEQPPV